MHDSEGVPYIHYPLDNTGIPLDPGDILHLESASYGGASITFTSDPNKKYIYRNGRLIKLEWNRARRISEKEAVYDVMGVIPQVHRIDEFISIDHNIIIARLEQRDDVFLYRHSADVSVRSHQAQRLLQYLTEAAQESDRLTEQNPDEDRPNIGRLYDATSFLTRSETVLSLLLEHNKPIQKYQKSMSLVFPFSTNKSQRKALEQALQSQISIIQGPPGTGKTQTILNIIANLVIAGKTVAVVSNNNSAIENVYEKFDRAGLSFFIASLGSKAKKQEFQEKALADKESGTLFPDMEGWALTATEEQEIRKSLMLNLKDLDMVLDLQNELARLADTLEKVKLEEKHCVGYTEEQETDKVIFPAKWHSTKLIELLHDSELYLSDRMNWLQRFLLVFSYPRTIRKQFFSMEKFDGYGAVIRTFYQRRKRELQDEVTRIQGILEEKNAESLSRQVTESSLSIFKSDLARRYFDGKKKNRAEYNPHAGREFLKEYPVVLSTLYSIASCVDCPYDYMIIDEASQASVLTGAQALAYAKNVVFVGDMKQLPAIVKKEDAEAYQNIERKYPQLPPYLKMSDPKTSLLSAIDAIRQDMPRLGIPIPELLKEHYRCSPVIARFFNERFYDNQLIIMTQQSDSSGQTVLTLCPPCLSERRFSSQNQVDQIRGIIAQEGNGDLSDFGVITSYRAQKALLQKNLGGFDDIEIDTVHKYQGREKRNLIFSTAAYRVTETWKEDFLNNANLINVAVSRAQERLWVLTSPDVYVSQSVVGDLCRYMEDNGNTFSITEMPSIFLLLFKEFATVREHYFKKHPQKQEFTSEALMEIVIQELLEKPKYQALRYEMHVPLCTLKFLDADCEDTRTRAFLSNRWSHVDFLIFDAMNRRPILAIEVQGYTYHIQEKQQERDAIKKRVFETAGIPLHVVWTQKDPAASAVTDTNKAREVVGLESVLAQAVTRAYERNYKLKTS